MAIHKIGGKTTEDKGTIFARKNLQEVLHIVTIHPFTRNENITLNPTNMTHILNLSVDIPQFGSYLKEGISYDVKWTTPIHTGKWVDYGSVFPSHNNNLEVPDSILDISDFHRNGLYFHDGTNVVHCRFSSTYSPHHRSFNVTIALRCLSGSFTFNPTQEFLSTVFPAHSKCIQIIITNSSGSIEVGGKGGGPPGSTGKFYFVDGANYDIKGDLIQANHGGPFEYEDDGWKYAP